MREQYAFYSKVAIALGAFLAVDAYILGFLSNWFYRETEFFFAFLSISAAYACLYKQREADQKIAARSIKPITDQFRSKDQMISDMKKRVEHDLRSEYNNSSSKTRRYSPMRSADRASIFGGPCDEFTVRNQRSVEDDRRRSATTSVNKRDEPMSMTPSAMKAESSWQQAMSPLIKPRNPTGPQVEYVYLNTFDPVQNDREASRSISQHTCYMSSDQIDVCLRYTRTYLLSEMPTWLLSKYVDSLDRLVSVASQFGISLVPEEFYFGADKQINRNIMIDAVLQVFRIPNQRDKIMSVDSFIGFVREEISIKNWSRLTQRVMTNQDKEMVTEAIDAVKHHLDLQSVFKNIQRASIKYTGLEAYVIWRLAELIDDPKSFDHCFIMPSNQTKFVTNMGLDGGSANLLPSDSEIIAAVFTGLMDLSSAALKHPAHLFSHEYSSKLKYMIPQRIADKNVKKYVAALINTQPVNASSNKQQCVPHFEVVRGDERIPMPTGEDNIFYCVMVAFVHIIKEYKKRSVSAYGPSDSPMLEVRYGDYDWIDAINFIFSQDGKGSGGPLHSNLLKNDYSQY